MKQLLLATILLFSTLTLVAQDYARVSKAEFERHRHRYNQLFDTNAFSPEERLQVIDTYYNTILSDQEVAANLLQREFPEGTPFFLLPFDLIDMIEGMIR